MLGSYRRDMQRAWNRIHAVPTPRLQTRFGMVEYAQRGDGLPLLNCHGVLGCHADGVDGWWANMLGEGFRVISPARFGYFGSTLQPTATPADQADAYTLLLDDLGIDRVAILGYSAGSASVLEFALRHPDRAMVLILANARLGGSAPNKLLKPVLGAVYGSDRLFWVYRVLLPSVYGRMVGVPKGYQPTPGDMETIRAVSELQFPLRPRKAGLFLTGSFPNLVADRFPLERLAVPTLVVSAVDDHWAPSSYAAMAAERIPGGKLVTIDQGGHLFLSHDTQVRTAIAAFIAAVTQPKGEGR